jgi:diguanylate cyclase (GGDEF)-like protein/PAS domain S-box-containing protein
MSLAARLFAPGTALASADALAGLSVAIAVCAAGAPAWGVEAGAALGLSAGAAIAASLGLRRARALAGALAERGRHAAASMQESEARYRLLAEHAGDMIVLTRADRTRAYVSPSCRALLGYEPDELLGVDFAPFVHPEDRARVEAMYVAFCDAGGRTTCSYRLRCKDGTHVWVESTWVTIPAAGGASNEVVAIVRDVSGRKAAEERIAFLSRHDTVTGMANRALLRERAEDALRRVGRGGALALLSIDLDRFQAINDQLGHAAGDVLLCTVAERLAAAVRETDTIARLDGAAFAVLQAAIDRPEEAGRLAERLLGVLAAPFEVEGRSASLMASIGIAVAPADGMDFETLLKNSGTALLRCKQDERGAWRFFEPGMEARRGVRQALTLDLRNALANTEFELFYQAQVALHDGRITGFEALLRWRHPSRGLVSPAEFIPIAEDTGLIVPLGAWVLRQACAEAMRWPRDIIVAVNLSPVQLRSPALPRTIGAALAASGLPPRRLELEITESVLLHEDEQTLATMRGLRDMGVRISMDDFGTGYASLRYLRSFPFDKIKLDQSFVRDLAAGPEAMAIVRAVAGLGRGLGITTLAEGVESERQLERLRAAGYSEAQGFYFNRPSPSHAIAGVLAANRAETCVPAATAVPVALPAS